MPADDIADKEILYVADPMCSWCWGFSPTLRVMAETAQDRAGFTLMMGGLRPLSRTPMDDNQKAEIRHHWDSVAERSGQPFDHAFFERDGFIYDTEPACRAVCVVRAIAPAMVLDYFEAIQRAFYSANRDITDPAVLLEFARKCGVDNLAFEERFNDVASAYETAGDFHSARQLSVTGYPTVILRKAKEFGLLSAGFQPWEALQPTFEGWLNS